MYIVLGILIALIITVAVVLALAASKPDTFRVARSTNISARPEKIFPQINDFHHWQAWSPWEALDPNMKKTHSGSPEGQGAVYEWSGNNKAGAGRMEITDSAAPGKVTIKLDFIKPFEGHNVIEFALVPSGDTTNLTWTMTGPCPFAMKIFHVFMNMDTLIGRDFERGLVNLKILAEK
jgi:hypothetical protein